MAVQHTLSVLPSEILTKISSSLSIQDLARSYSIHVSWAKHVEDKLLEYINDELRVVVFDDSCQTHCVWLPFAGFQKGIVSYREASCMDCPKSDELAITPHWLHSRSYGRQGWMHCNVDLAQTTLFLDLAGATLGYPHIWRCQARIARSWARSPAYGASYS